ncbi:glycosyl transferase family 2 [bacterium]|nr:glycosyl transferase family 2 [bacterium]
MQASIVIVHFGDFKPTAKCISSVYKTSKNAGSFEIILVDNNLDDSARKKFARKFPSVTYIKSEKNNYCHALNIGTQKSKSEIIVILNPDTIVKKDWLIEILKPFKDKKIGGVSSKVIFKKTGKINSLGIEEIDDFYYRDAGFNEDDDPNMKQRAIDFASGASVAYRKKALEECGMFDEDFVMYVEDVDMGIKMKKNGWKLVLNPKSAILHAYHGTTKGADLPWYFCNRNRFLLIAKHYPKKFAEQIEFSHPYINKQFDYLYDFLKVGIYKLIKSHPEEIIEKVLPEILVKATKIYPLDRVQNMINEIEIFLRLRKPTVCLYDHALHFIGGGQKYGCTIAESLRKDYDVTFVCNKPVTVKQLEKWYDLNLDGCSLKKIELPINKKDSLINPSLANSNSRNPFAPVEDEVLQHDIFINVNMVPHVNALALKNIFICHFPDSPRANFFYVQNYKSIVTNSKYTTGWLEKKWQLKANKIIYPPVDMKYLGQVKKENIILSVSRFEEGGSKKQMEMINAFWEMCKKYPGKMSGWKLFLAGGSTNDSKYVKRLKLFIKSHDVPVEIKENIGNSELKKLYATAKIFWHACGLNVDPSKNPNLIEHFGMTTVEAMQNGCAPIVIDGGGQKEIVEHGKNGFKFKNEKQLKKFTLNLVENEKLLEKIGKSAVERSKDFSKNIFQKSFKELIDKHYESLLKTENFIPEAHHIYKKLTSSS